MKGRPLTRRAPGSVDTLLLHQTAVRGGFGARTLDARVLRYCGTGAENKGTPYHYVYSPKDGVLVAIWHPRLYTYHGNGGNRGSVALAVDGHWPGKGGDPLDPAALEDAVTTVLDDVLANGYRLALLGAHRQHSDQRGRDPGPEIWGPSRSAGERWGLQVSTVVTGSGKQIPADWG